MTAAATGVRTQQEVADALGISRARVMQLEQSALRKMRLALIRADAEQAKRERSSEARR
jgi:DNA-directed RNA polymerase sigma subunit (sigma70/sigma32)